MSYPLKRELAVGNRILSFIEVAQKKGYLVELFSLAGDSIQDLQGVRRFEIAQAPRVFPGFVGRALSEALMARRLLSQLKKQRYDRILVSIPSMFLLFLFSGRFCGTFHLDLRDLTWEYLSDQSIVQKAAKRFFRKLARKRINCFSTITVTNQTEYDYLRNQFEISETRLCMAPNGISNEQFQILAKTYSKVEKSEEPLTISYVGNVGIPQNLSVLVAAAQELPEVRFNLVGTGENLAKVRRRKEEANLSNLIFLGSLPWQDLIRIYRESDVLYAQLNRNFKGAVPSKLYEYLATGKFIIYGGEGEAIRLMSAFDNNLIIPPDNPQALIDAIRKVRLHSLHQNLSSRNQAGIASSFIREKNLEKCFEMWG